MNRGVKLSFAMTLGFCGLTGFSGAVLTSPSLFATEISATASANATVTVPEACTMTSGSNNDSPHAATISAGTNQSDIGLTTFKVICNDHEGFSIYAIGYANQEEGNTKLLAKINNTLAPTYDIETGLSMDANTSSWAMKLTAVSGTYAPTIQSDTNGSFSNYHVVPASYTKVATFNGATDGGTNAAGSAFTSTYRANIAGTQPAGTYNGKVKYAMVHPASAPAPVPVSKNLYYAITGSANNYTLTISDTDITSGAVAGGPVAIDGYEFDQSQWTATTPWYSYASQIKSVAVTGTVAPTSTRAWFAVIQNCDSWNLSGLRTDHVTDMSSMFYYAGYNATTFTLDLSNWNTSSVTNMSSMFWDAGRSAPSFTLDLSSWNTSSVTDMSYMFNSAGHSATTWSVGDLSSWNTSSVTDMSWMFYYAGYSATTWSVGDLSNWNTANVTTMANMFSYAGYSATTWSVGDLSNWNTASVTSMSAMFDLAGRSATTFTLDLSSWNISNVVSLSTMFSNAGYSATTWSVGDLSNWDTSSVTSMNRLFHRAGYSATTFTLNLSNWDTSSVTNMYQMFYNSGYSAATWSVTIPKTNNGTTTGSISNTTSLLYGSTTSTYAAPLSGKSFTLAN